MDTLVHGWLYSRKYLAVGAVSWHVIRSLSALNGDFRSFISIDSLTQLSTPFFSFVWSINCHLLFLLYGVLTIKWRSSSYNAVLDLLCRWDIVQFSHPGQQRCIFKKTLHISLSFGLQVVFVKTLERFENLVLGCVKTGWNLKEW